MKQTNTTSSIISLRSYFGVGLIMTGLLAGGCLSGEELDTSEEVGSIESAFVNGSGEGGGGNDAATSTTGDMTSSSSTGGGDGGAGGGDGGNEDTSSSSSTGGGDGGAGGEEDPTEEDPTEEEPECKPFEPTSPPPTQGPPFPTTPPPGACSFYGKVTTNPGGCSKEERKLIGGYHQTCSNVSTGVSVTPDGANCGLQTHFRAYVETFRYCLQEEVTDLSTTDGCLNPGTSCGDVVDNIRDAHSGCNEQTDFCGTMENADAGYCFGYSIGDAWGAPVLGTLPLGPAAPLGASGTLASICVCDDPVAVQRNICAGYRQGCMDRDPLNTQAALACAAACPDPAILAAPCGLVP